MFNKKHIMHFENSEGTFTRVYDSLINYFIESRSVDEELPEQDWFNILKDSIEDGNIIITYSEDGKVCVTEKYL